MPINYILGGRAYILAMLELLSITLWVKNKSEHYIQQPQLLTLICREREQGNHTKNAKNVQGERVLSLTTSWVIQDCFNRNPQADSEGCSELRKQELGRE